ncbi:hypothetical protein CEXT_3941, partial [Caerostris extrusa]
FSSEDLRAQTRSDACLILEKMPQCLGSEETTSANHTELKMTPSYLLTCAAKILQPC